MENYKYISAFIDKVYNNKLIGGSKNNTYVGFIDNQIICAIVDYNTITWKILASEGLDFSTDELEKRLKDFEDEESGIYSEIKSIGHILRQTFHFKGE